MYIKKHAGQFATQCQINAHLPPLEVSEANRWELLVITSWWDTIVAVVWPFNDAFCSNLALEILREMENIHRPAGSQSVYLNVFK